MPSYAHSYTRNRQNTFVQRDRNHDRQRDSEREAHAEDEDSPLVRRLRNLTWPEVPADVRDRCWREFQKMMAASRLGRDAGEPEPDEGSPAE
jgi:hypothetical protein